MIAADLVYDFPQAAYLLFGSLVFFWLWCRLYYHRKEVLSQNFQPAILERLMVPRSGLNFWGKTLAICFVWGLAAFALMQPKGNERYASSGESSKVFVRQKSHEIIFLIDASASMNILDASGGQARLKYAKEIADQLAALLRGEMVSLYAFTSDVVKLVPATNDILFLRLMLKDLQINEGEIGGTDFNRTFKTLKEEYLSRPLAHLKTIVLFSDGGDTLYEAEKSEEGKKKRIEEIIGQLNFSKEYELKVFTVGIGSKQGGEVPGVTFEGKPVHANLDRRVMESIAKSLKGAFYAADEMSAIDIAASLAKIVNNEQIVYKEETREKKGTSKEMMVYDLYFQYPLGMAIVFLGLVLFLPDSAYLKKELLAFFKRTTPFALFLLFHSSLFAADQPYKEEMGKAAAYFQAKDYTSAEDVYKNLLKMPLSKRESSIIHYDLGTTLLAENNLVEAIEAFQAITLTEISDPLIKYRLYQNLGVGYLREGLRLLSTSTTEENFRKVVVQLRESTYALEEAEKAFCLYKQLEGNEKCTLPSDLVETITVAKKNLSDTLIQQQTFISKQAELPRSLPLLMLSLKELLENLTFIDNRPVPSDLQTKYIERFAAQADSWEPIWSSIYAKQYDQIHDAYKYYHVAVRFMEKKRWDLSYEAIKDAQAQLNTMINDYRKNASPADLYRFLLNLYVDALAENPLQQSSLLHLDKFQKEMVLYFFAAPLTIGTVQENLNSALSAISQGKSGLARVFLEEAAQDLKELIEKSSAPKTHQDPITTLEKAIDAQKHALKVYRYFLTISKSELIAKLIRQTQEKVLLKAKDFITSAIVSQQQNYQKEWVPGLADTRCQYHPWNEVMPLFIKGKRSAETAAAYLGENGINGSSAISEEQRKTVESWMDGLAKLKEPPQTGKCGTKKEENEPEQKDQQMDDVLTALQQMDLEDKPSPQSFQANKEVLRPW